MENKDFIELVALATMIVDSKGYDSTTSSMVLEEVKKLIESFENFKKSMEELESF